MRKRRGEWGADAGKRGRRDGDGHKRITSRGEGERGEKGVGEGGGGADAVRTCARISMCKRTKSNAHLFGNCLHRDI